MQLLAIQRHGTIKNRCSSERCGGMNSRGGKHHSDCTAVRITPDGAVGVICRLKMVMWKLYI